MVTTKVPTIQPTRQPKTLHTQPYSTRAKVKGTSSLVEKNSSHLIEERSENQSQADTQSLDLTNTIKLAFREKLKTSLSMVKGGIHNSDDMTLKYLILKNFVHILV